MIIAVQMNAVIPQTEETGISDNQDQWMGQTILKAALFYAFSSGIK